jgi:hypothetical protein
LKVVNYFLTKILRIPPIRELTERHIEEDNLQNLLLKIALWMAHTLIPKYSDENLESTTDPPKYVIVSTLTEYLSKAKETIKNKFPKHEDWKDESWWTDMRAGFVTEATRQQFREMMSSVIGPPDHCIRKIALVLPSSREILN